MRLQVKHETLTSVMQKLEAEMENLRKALDTTRDRQRYLGDMFSKLDAALAAMEIKLKRCDMEGSALNKEIVVTDKAFMRADQDNSALEQRMVDVLGEQTTTEKGSGRTAADIQRLRKEVCPAQHIINLNFPVDVSWVYIQDFTLNMM